MNKLPENEFDLEKLFLPAWAQEDPLSSAKYAKYEGEQERLERRGDRRGPRPPRREGGPPGRRPDRRPGGPGEQRGPRPESAAPAGQRPGGRDQRFPGPRFEPRERREPPPPLPELDLAFVPDDKGVESLARQIKMTGRAYPLFDIAQMILQKPERHRVVFKTRKKPDGQPIQPLFVCALDDTLWLSEDEAVSHILRKHFGTFYQTERTPTEPPKGKYTFVAQCGMSGIILGPPNHHDYQNQLRKLHTERFSRMPFEVYRSRVKIVRDEEVVKKWVEDQSFKTEYICLNLPEPLRLGSMDEVEQHFRGTHKENIIKPTETHTLEGVAARNLRTPDLTRAVRAIWEDQKRFPLQLATYLSQQFAARGLQFFKVNKAVTHVCVARPHFLDLAAAPVSDGVRRIVEFINAKPKCTRRQLVEALAPTPQPPAPVEGQPAPTPAPEPGQPTPEQTAVIADLHWLVHQGHVIEFANGVLETAKKPVPKPPRPEPKPAAKPAETVAPAVAGEAVPAGEVSQTPATEAPAVQAVDAPEAEPVPVAAPEAQSQPAAASSLAELPPAEGVADVAPAEPPVPAAEATPVDAVPQEPAPPQELAAPLEPEPAAEPKPAV